MSWVKIDDQFPTPPKVVAAGGDAAWLHVCALCYCAQHLTDGMVPRAMLERISDRKNARNLAERLIEVGMWIDRGDEVEIHGYLDYNPSREKVLEERRKAAERRANGARASAERRANDACPDPTRPVVPSEQLGAGPDPRVAALVAGYIDDYSHDRDGKRPPGSWISAASTSIRRALVDTEEPEDIARCLGVIARESKNPSTLPHVLADMHAGKPRRT